MTKTMIALATAVILGTAAAALAAEPNEGGGARTFGAPGQGATQGVNAADHPQAAASCAKKYKSYDPSDMTYRGADGKRHACP
jgi:BA14K-like protein